MPIGSPPLEGGAIAVSDDGRIAAVGPVADLQDRFTAPLTEFSGGVIMPGFVNAHTHLELTHFPSWRLRKGIDYSPRTYSDWAVQLIKIKRSLTSDELQHSVREGIRISLESGTTTVGEILSDSTLADIYRQSPLFGRMYFEAIGQDPAHCSELQARIEKRLTDPEQDFAHGISPHTPFTLSEEFLKKLAVTATHHKVPTAIHVAEPPEEVDFMYDTTGRIAETLYPYIRWEQYLPPPRRLSPVAYLDRAGALGPKTACIHCVHVTPADAETLRARGASIILCPRSNDMLAVGRAPVFLYKKLGIPLALGTDSLASNDSISLWDEIRYLMNEFPGVFSAEEAIEMATAGGAKVLQLGDQVGTLAPGKRADFQVVEAVSGINTADLASRLINHARIIDVFVKGKSLGI